MSEIMTAVFHAGAFVPDHVPALAEGERVRLVVQPLSSELAEAIAEFDSLCEGIEIDVAAEKMTRDQLHERD